MEKKKRISRCRHPTMNFYPIVTYSSAKPFHLPSFLCTKSFMQVIRILTNWPIHKSLFAKSLQAKISQHKREINTAKGLYEHRIVKFAFKKFFHYMVITEANSEMVIQDSSEVS